MRIVIALAGNCRRRRRRIPAPSLTRWTCWTRARRHDWLSHPAGTPVCTREYATAAARNRSTSPSQGLVSADGRGEGEPRCRVSGRRRGRGRHRHVPPDGDPGVGSVRPRTGQADFTARFTSADVTPMATVPRAAARRPARPPSRGARSRWPARGGSYRRSWRAGVAARRVRGGSGRKRRGDRPVHGTQLTQHTGRPLMGRAATSREHVSERLPC
jgi:hypothetical protein